MSNNTLNLSPDELQRWKNLHYHYLLEEVEIQRRIDGDGGTGQSQSFPAHAWLFERGLTYGSAGEFFQEAPIEPNPFEAFILSGAIPSRFDRPTDFPTQWPESQSDRAMKS